MKKLFTLSVITLLAIGFYAFYPETSPEKKGNDDDAYRNAKNFFYNQYLHYKATVSDQTKAMVPPVDPSGNFMIDRYGNFSPKYQENLSVPADFLDGDAVSSGYTWTQPAGTYSTITGGAGTVTLATGGIDDNVYGTIPIGFTFNFDCSSYTQIGLCANGWISMSGTTPTNSYTPLSGTTRNVIAVMAADLLGNTTGRIEYQTSGTAPNRVFTVQWSNWAFYNVGVVDGSVLNFQIKLFETSNNIQLIYGSNSQSATSHTVQVGLGGAATSDYNNRTTTTNWAATTAGASNAATCTMSTTVVPALNLTFQWAPSAVAMTYTSSTTTQYQNGNSVLQNSTNNCILGFQVVTGGGCSPGITVTQINANTTGSTNPATDITNAKIWYTGTSATFAATTQFGTTFSSPSGAFTINGSQSLQPGTNYFWLTYDVPAGATLSNLLDAQAVSIVGSSPMGTVTPTVTNPAGWRQIDNYCRGTFSLSGCTGTHLFISNVTFNTLNNTSVCDPNTNNPYFYNWYTSPITNVEQGTTYPISITQGTNPTVVNPAGFAVWIDWNNNNLFSDAGEYFSIGTTTSGGTPVITGYIPIPGTASLGNHRMRVRMNLSTVPANGNECAALSYGETEDYTINVVSPTTMVYSSSTTTQITGNFYTPQTNLGIIGVQVVTTGSLSPLSLTSMTLNTNGSTNPATDLTNAKVWYTGISPTFTTTTQVGSTFNSPNGSFTISGSQVLQPGTNYFWVTYDVPGTATTSDFVDAECNSITVGSSFTPTVQAPAGNRQILGSTLCGTYTIPGSYATIAAAITDLNLRGISCPVVFNVAAGYTETMPSGGYTITVPSANSTNTITFQKSGAGANPLISTTAAGLGTTTTSSYGSIGDAFFKINGTDYITFDGINVTDLYTGVATGPKMEYGFILNRASATDGCKNVTIKNCVITFALNNVTSISAGIYTSNFTAAGISTTPTSIAGRHENIFIDGNTIYNTISGMYFDGYADPTAPYNLYNNNIQVGVNAGNTIICGSRGITNSTTVYGLYTQYADSIKYNNNIIRVNTGQNAATHYGIFNSTGTNSSVDVVGNTISDTMAYTVTSSSQQMGISNAMGSTGTNNTVNIQNNTISGCRYDYASGPTVTYIGNTGSAFTINISGNTVSGNSVGAGTTLATGTITGILQSAGNTTVGATLNIFNNNVNTITRTQSAAGTGQMMGIQVTSSSYTTNVYGNNVNTLGPNNTTSSTMAGIYVSSSATLLLNVYNNTVYGITRTAGTTTGETDGLYCSQSSPTSNIYGNTVYNITNSVTTTTGAVYGFYNSGISSTADNFYNNTFYNISSSGNSTVVGARVSNGTVPLKNVYGNTIYNVNSGAGTTGGQAGGLYIGFATTGNVYKNKIYNVTSYNSTGLSPAVFGLGLFSSGTTYYVYNNFISELKAPVATVALPSTSIIGIFQNVGAAYMFNNTVYLDAASTGATFSSTCVWSSTTYNNDLRNNILINKSTPTGTGLSVAYQRNSTTLTSYLSTSDKNNFYAGTPGANRVLYYDGTNSDQTLAAFKTRVGPTRDANSVTENTTFVNTAASPYDLHLSSCSFSQCESGGGVISTPIAITTDYDGDARYPNAGYPACSTYTPIAPDIGADEYAGQFLDAVPPVISYTQLGNDVVGTGRSFTGVSITDPGSGVNTTSGTRPRVYYRKTTDANTYAGNTYCDNGWKYAEANGTSTPFDFSIDYTKLYDPMCLFGGMVNPNDTIEYFVVAQDLAGTPNAGWLQATFTSNPTTVGLSAGNFPVTGTYRYTIGATFSGAYYIGTGQPYLTLSGSTQGFFQAINSGVVTGNITAYITSDITEPGTVSLNSVSYSSPGANYTITIKPLDAVEKVISGNVATPMLIFNGSDYITIDGNGGLDAGTKYLRFRNTSGVAPTFQFINDARRNTITNCYIESNNQNVATLPGTIMFGTTTGTSGNDSNTISDCDIRDNSDASGTHTIAVFSQGSTSTVAQGNSDNVFTGNNIYNFFTNGQTANAAFYLSLGTTAWTISGNSMYQTSTRTTTIATGYNIIFISNSLGDGFTISNNYIGGTAPNCGGTPLTITTSTAAVTNFVYPIRFSSAGVTNVSTISGNTIANFDITLDAPAAAGTLYFDALLLQVGAINVTNNTIGSQSANDNIKVTVTSGVNGIAFFGVDMRGVIGSVTNNTIGGFTYAGGNTGTLIMAGINEGSTSTTPINVTGNTIGGTVTNSMYDSRGGSVLAQMTGIRSSQAGIGLLPSYSNNTIRNFTDIGTGGGFLTGISHSGTSSAQINSNTIFNLNSASSLAGGFSGTLTMCGISLTSAGLGATINANTIYNINNTNTGANSPYVFGIQVTNSAATVTENGNRIYGLTNQATGSPVIAGINQYWGAAGCNITNNQVTITNGETTDNDHTGKYINSYNNIAPVQNINKENRNPVQNNIIVPVDVKKKKNGEGSGKGGDDKNGRNQNEMDKLTGTVTVNEEPVNENPYKENTELNNDYTNGMTIYGIYNDATGVQNIYYNSVYIGGSSSAGALSTYSFRKPTASHNLFNNLFVNARTNSGSATGKHYVIYSTSTTASSLNANYNVYIGSDLNTIGLWGAADQTFAQWKTSLAKDQQSYSTITSDINPSNLFASIGSGNLGINTGNTEAWIVSGKGIAITGQSTDFNGDARFVSIGSGTTDIGSDEISALGTTPPSAVVDNPPGSGVNSTYTLWGRPITKVTWNTGGSSYPTSLDVKYYSGVNPPNTLGGNYSNSHTVINATGLLTGADYNIVYYFGDNETYTIGSPGANTILAKYGSGGSWEVFHLTQPVWNTVLVYNTSTQTFTTTVNGLFDFSTFALTDDGAALPVIMESFEISAMNRDAVLNWATASEINNKGFAVERRSKLDAGYSSWKEVGFVNGNGTSNERHAYTFRESKMNAGIYQYRLKQIDYNNNPEYFSPQGNMDIVIGKPGVFDISQNYPNPSNPKTKIDFQMPFDGKVSLKVYDLLGQEVVSLADGFKTADYYTVEFDGSNLASGVYFYRIVAEGNNQKFIKTMKMVLVK